MVYMKQMQSSTLPNFTDDYSMTLDKTIVVTTTFAIEHTSASAGTSRRPFFRFSNSNDTEKLQWQRNPHLTGPLRYTLVEVDPSGTDDEGTDPNSIVAIYHHIAQFPSFSVYDSEGVLLLPENTTGSVSEEDIIASLLGLLWTVRGLVVKHPVVEASRSRRKSLLGRIFTHLMGVRGTQL